MKEPFWIRIDVLLAEQKAIIAEHGGLEGTRDANLSHSSCVAPQQLYFYSKSNSSILELAARYAYSITRNHPFRDGNKRMALQACEIFLELNEYSLEASQEEKYLTFLDLAKGELTEEQLIQWIKKNTVQHSSV